VSVRLLFACLAFSSVDLADFKTILSLMAHVIAVVFMRKCDAASACLPVGLGYNLW
jgi:hypothetical protein